MRLEGKEAPVISTELAVIGALQSIVPADFFKPHGSEGILAALKTEVRQQAAALDISTETGRAAIASLAYKVARSKTALDDQGKALVESQKKSLAEIDTERRKVREELDALKEEVRKPLTDWENADKMRVAGHEAALLEMAHEADGIPVWTIAECEEKLQRVHDRFNSRQWEEFLKRAQDTRHAALFVIQRAAAEARHKEEQRLEAERLRAEALKRAIKEREDAAAKAARWAAERRAEEQARMVREAAERERQRIENERIEAEARAKQAEAARIAAEQKAARDAKEAEARAERMRVEVEKQRIAAEQTAERRAQEAAAQAKRDQEAAIEAERRRVAAEEQRKREETEARERNKAHRAKVNREAKEGFIRAGLAPEVAELAVVAIAKGIVPHIAIAY